MRFNNKENYHWKKYHDNKLRFTTFNTVISPWYKEMPIEKFFIKFEEDIRKGKFKCAVDDEIDKHSYGVISYFHTFSSYSDWYGYYSTYIETTCLSLTDEDKINIDNNMPDKNIAKFIKLIELQKFYDRLKEAEKIKNKRIDEIIENGDKGIFPSEESKKIYIESLKKSRNFFYILKDKESLLLAIISFVKHRSSTSNKVFKQKIAFIEGKFTPKQTLLIEEALPTLTIKDPILNRINDVYQLLQFLNDEDIFLYKEQLEELLNIYNTKMDELIKNEKTFERFEINSKIIESLTKIEFNINLLIKKKREIELRQKETNDIIESGKILTHKMNKSVN